MPFTLQPKALTYAKADDQKAYWQPNKLQSHPLYSGKLQDFSSSTTDCQLVQCSLD
jgi:hypothetical protein